tara:strand:+ start:80 stop:592 length:513 start_codon:yes stop_codon:yes gene_type:complete
VKITLKSIKNKNINKIILNKIIKLKIEEWNYNKKLQLRWIKFNLEDEDLHNLLYVNNDICGYTCLREKAFFLKNRNKKIYYFDTFIIKKKYRSKTINKKKLSDILMRLNIKKINQKCGLAILVCNKKLVKFYKKYNWKRSNAFKINKNRKYVRMIFNQKKLILKNKSITI